MKLRVVLLVLVALLGGGIWCRCVLPELIFSGAFDRDVTDAELIDAFGKHRAECEELLAMIRADATVRSVAADSIGAWLRLPDGWHHMERLEESRSLDAVLADVGLSPTRYEKYLSLLRSVGGHSVHALPPASSRGYEVSITMASRGTVVSGVGKSFVHVDSGLAPPDRPPRPGDDDRIVYTRLADHWFLSVDER